MSNTDCITNAAKQFGQGEFISAVPWGNGHINDSYCVEFLQNGTKVKDLLQRINHNVFKNPVALMDNIDRVTKHLTAKSRPCNNGNKRVLQLNPAMNGSSYYVDETGNYWRCYQFIDNAQSYDMVESPQQAFEAAKAFGAFQEQLVDLPLPRLYDTIPDFHHAPKRFEALEKAIAEDVAGRVSSVQAEIAFVRRHKHLTTSLLSAGLPERITHNDCKFNNVLLNASTGEGICVIDLDTVMPGLAAYDFGDMVRTTTCAAAEDERDLSKIKMSFPMFEALARGYLSSVQSFITEKEKQTLPDGAALITFVIGIRFLTDYLSGDTYFKIHHEGHNLDRCRTQFKLVESIEQQWDQINQLIRKI